MGICLQNALTNQGLEIIWNNWITISYVFHPIYTTSSRRFFWKNITSHTHPCMVHTCLSFYWHLSLQRSTQHRWIYHTWGCFLNVIQANCRRPPCQKSFSYHPRDWYIYLCLYTWMVDLYGKLMVKISQSYGCYGRLDHWWIRRSGGWFLSRKKLISMLNLQQKPDLTCHRLHISRWWFQILLVLTLPGEMIQFP